MFRCAALVVLMSLVTMAPLPAVATPSASDAGPAQARAAKPRPVLKVSARELLEGDRLVLRVRVPRARSAKKVLLQERYVSIFGHSEWRDVRSRKATKQTRFTVTVTAENTASYRAAVSYRGKPTAVTSKTVSVKVWRWIPARSYTPYYSTPRTVFEQSTINGRAYATWGAASYSGTTRAWESRVTPGRNCKAFRGVLGLLDSSADGSSGVISFTTDETSTVYTSPSLTPGMEVPLHLDLAMPYRFGLSAANTSMPDVKAFPVVGDPAFLCTGVS